MWRTPSSSALCPRAFAPRLVAWARIRGPRHCRGASSRSAEMRVPQAFHRLWYVMACLSVIASSAQGQQALRFPVLHMHTTSVCYGYLYVAIDSIRYEAVRPQSDQGHSFDVGRDQLQSVGRWVLFGRPQDVAELRVGGATYRFKLLTDTTQVRTRAQGGPSTTAPNLLLAALRNPARIIAEAESIARSRLDTTRAAAPAGEPRVAVGRNTPPVAPAGMLDGVYNALTIGTGAHVIRRFLIFYPDGRVMNGMPEQGLEGFNVGAFFAKSGNEVDKGRYHVEGQQILIGWQYWPDHQDTVSYQTVGDLGSPDVYIPLCRCDGERFSGLYMWDTRSGIEFFPNGSFVDHGVIDQLDTELGHFTNPRVRRGSYRVQNFTLYLDFQDGQHLQTSFGAPAFQAGNHAYNWISIYGYQILHRQ